MVLKLKFTAISIKFRITNKELKLTLTLKK